MILVSVVAEARMWTDTTGKKLEAKTVWVNADRNVKLKISPEEIIIVPFSAFVEKDIEHRVLRVEQPESQRTVELIQ